jgi:3-hydroxyacyl-CoA dehydrogenase
MPLFDVAGRAISRIVRAARKAEAEAEAEVWETRLRWDPCLRNDPRPSRRPDQRSPTRMPKQIRRVAVLGAGVMGSGIAAHLANAGVDALLLDIVPPNLTDAEKKDPAARNRFAAGGLEKALKNKPALFFHPSRAIHVQVGNFEDDLAKVKDCDLVIEAIIEKMEAKQSLFAKLESLVGPETIVASNTSGLRISEMLAGRSASFKERFLVMHFFNPVRYMKLLELVAGPETRNDVLANIRRFGEDVLGKGIVIGKDTPNFVGNRIGTYSMMVAIHQMLADGLEPEDVDALAGEPMGRPKSAAFRTADLVGVDTFVHVADNCYASLTNDEEREVFKMPAFIRTMTERKQFGDKTKGGFYKKSGKDIETLDPRTGEYRPKKQNDAIKATVKSLKGVEETPERVKRLVSDTGAAGDFAWKTISKTLAYTARRVGEITDDLTAIDDAMKWGYNWELGPFETWDAIGFQESLARMEKDGLALPEWVKKMKASGAKSFYAEGNKIWDPKANAYKTRDIDPRTRSYSSLKTSVIAENDGAYVSDIGEGVFALTFKTKANSIDPDVIAMIHTAVDRAERDARALIVYNEGEHFGVGANLFLVVGAAMQGQWEDIRKLAGELQRGTQRLKYSKVPVVAAPFGMALGGGLEVCLGAGNIQAAAETYAGLVEVGVGLIPAGGGCMNLMWRAFEGVPDGMQFDPYAAATQVFKNIALARVATSAAEAQEFGYFRRTDGISFDKARLLHEAKRRAIGLAEAGYHAPTPRAHKLPGDSGIATLKMMVGTLVQTGQASEHDALIATKLANVLCGGVDGAQAPVSEERMLELEAEAFVSLCGEPKTQERMQYMLMNNKPLRN